MAGLFKFGTIALKNLFSKPATRAYPDVPARQTPRTRGAVQVKIEDCIFCGLCNRRCPADAISVDRQTKSWTIRRMSCVQCGNCVQNCPKRCLTMEPAYPTPGADKRNECFRKTESPIPAPHTLAPAPADGKPIAPERVLVLDISTCVLCGLCAHRCPTGALQVDRKAGTWTVNRAACLQCGNCVNGCPKHSLALVPQQGQPDSETYTKSAAPQPVREAHTPAVTAQPEGAVGIAVDMDSCILCGLCVRRCPTEAIKVDRKAGVWSINRQSCVVCGNCLEVCHKHSLIKTAEGISTDGIQTYQKPQAAPAKPESAPADPPASPAADPANAPTGEGIAIDMASCILCGLCGRKCPTEAIRVDRKAGVWEISRSACILCGSCIEACPKKSLTQGEIPLLEKYTK